MMERVLRAKLDRSGRAERNVRHDREELVSQSCSEDEIVTCFVHEHAERVRRKSSDEIREREHRSATRASGEEGEREL